MSGEWRVIPDFPKYEINDLGQVRWADTHEQLTEYYNSLYGSYGYHLRKPDGNMTTKNYKGLMYSAFPEMLKGWKGVYGYPAYIINETGVLRSTKTWEFVKPYKTPGKARVVNAEGKRVVVHIADLLFDTYGIFTP